MLRSLFGRAAEDDADAEHFDHWQTTDLCWSAGAERRALARWRLWGRRMGGERKQVRKSPRRLPAAYLPEMGAARLASHPRCRMEPAIPRDRVSTRLGWRAMNMPSCET